MNPLSRKTLLTYLAGTFVLGAVAGGAIGYNRGKRPMFRSFNRDQMREEIKGKLTRDLSLNPEQVEKIDGILRTNMEELDTINRDHHKQIEVSMTRGRERIATLLNPEQKKILEAKDRERQARWAKNRPPGSGPGSGPGTPPLTPPEKK